MSTWITTEEDNCFEIATKSHATPSKGVWLGLHAFPAKLAGNGGRLWHCRTSRTAFTGGREAIPR